MKNLILLFAFTLFASVAFTQAKPPIATEVTLNGTAEAFGEGNRIVSVLWKQISGPATPRIETPNQLITKVTGYSVPGVYVYQLTVTDANENTATDRTTVTVLAPNLPPIARASSEIIIQLPLKK